MMNTAMIRKEEDAQLDYDVSVLSFNVRDAIREIGVNPLKLIFGDFRRRVDRRTAERLVGKSQQEILELAIAIGGLLAQVMAEVETVNKLGEIVSKLQAFAAKLQVQEGVSEEEAKIMAGLVDQTDPDIKALVDVRGPNAIASWRVIQSPLVVGQVISAIRVAIAMRTEKAGQLFVKYEKLSEEYLSFKRQQMAGQLLFEVETANSRDEPLAISLNTLAAVFGRLQRNQNCGGVIITEMPVASLSPRLEEDVLGKLGLSSRLALPAESMSIPVSMPVEVGCEEEFNS